MMNKVWALFIIVGILYGFLTGRMEVINQEIIASGEALCKWQKTLVF